MENTQDTQDTKTTNTNKFPTSRVAGAAMIVMISIVISRFTGFIREMLIPNYIGFDKYADAYNMAFKITGLMYDLLVGGAIAAALIPILSGYIAKKKEKEGWTSISTFINSIFILMIFTCGLGIIFAPSLVHLIAPGFTDPEEIALTISIVRILFPAIALLMLTGMVNGILNSYRRFVASAFGPAIYNVGCSISIIVFGGKNTNIKNIAYGIVLTSFLYLFLQIFLARKNLKNYRFLIDLKNPDFHKLLKLAIPSLIASSIVQVNILILSAFATFIGEGTVTAYNVADRAWQMPYGIFAQGLGIAILPTISALIALGEIENFKRTLSKGLKFVTFITIPCSIIFIILGNQVISTLFSFTSKFSASNITLTAGILAFFSLAMISQSLVAILNRSFYALNDTKTPLYTGISTVFVIFFLCLTFTHYIPLYAKGLALSYTIASTINAILLYALLVRKVGSLQANFRSFASKTIISSSFTMLFLFLANTFFFTNQFSKFLQIIRLTIVCMLGFSIYFGISMLLNLEESIYLKNLLNQKLFSRIFKRKQISS